MASLDEHLIRALIMTMIIMMMMILSIMMNHHESSLMISDAATGASGSRPKLGRSNWLWEMFLVDSPPGLNPLGLNSFFEKPCENILLKETNYLFFLDAI